MDVFAVAPHGALVLQGALGALGHRFGGLGLRWLTLATGLLGVRAEVCWVQAVACSDREGEVELTGGGSNNLQNLNTLKIIYQKDIFEAHLSFNFHKL